ncbi:Thermostable monoacylglycerol lipase [Aquicella lusitana]|uniref:Esterase/lipase n=2 Tax=Aquicella lusitana TaxID=254246 RepID=A0A370GGA0_9COXI|nr:esterase/lipase [Aquicella lusitana]VVC73065.1 Thermostable monoacylglycerol lipase [Aquicella lusitana]
MFDNLSATLSSSMINYPISDSSLPFSDYIARSRAIIAERRAAFSLFETEGQALDPTTIIDANSPFELRPSTSTQGRIKYGALLIHGLLDCPFSLLDIGQRLQKEGILSRAIVLPGHGTVPQDLLQVSYHDWLQAVRYGVESLKREVDHIFLVGYSTGAALSVYQALQDKHVQGIILLSPAIRIKAPVDIVVGWHQVMKTISRNSLAWVCQEREIDYAKYKSVALNPVNQVTKLTMVLRELRQHRPLHTPMLMIISHEDETISSHHAIDFFSSQHHENSSLLLYTAGDQSFSDPRILPRRSHYPELSINHFSHVSIPFSPDNRHYGQNGDYVHASRPRSNEVFYGAYNRIEEKLYDSLYQAGVIKRRRLELTYNPDFNFMAEKILHFIMTSK